MKIRRRSLICWVAAHLAVIAVATTTTQNPHDHGDKRYIGPEPRQAGSACTASTFSRFLTSNASVERVESVSAGSTYGDGARDLMYPIQPTNLPDLCAVTIEVVTSATSSYRFGLFLPAEWNGRFLAVGNGGFGGGINWLDMGAGVRYGFAVASTDTGHNSTTADVEWALDNPGRKADWGWRAMHGTVGLGKTLAQAYYSRPVSYAYYSGCSTGGRQGLKEIQISPSSFDGALVGAAAWYTSHLNTWVSKVATYNWPDDEPKHIDWRMFAPLAGEVMKQCDDIDGVADGIISLPDQCALDYEPLTCGTPRANRSACLTEPQIETLRNVYAGWQSSTTGEELYPGLTPGSERQFYLVLNYSQASPYGLGYARYFLLDDPAFALAEFDDGLAALADRLDPGNATADDYDLSAFRDRGGKVLMYHGTADGLVPTRGSGLYYERLVQTTAGGDAGAARDFFRYFMVPGMQHCLATVTDSPWAFGGASQAAQLGNDTWSVPGYRDAQHDALLALMDWVENGNAVDSIVASTWKEAGNASSGLLRQRPLCPYPEMARWDGENDVNAASSWGCGGNITEAIPSATSAAIRAMSNPFSAVVGLFRSLPM
ncbi:putative ferulic acid Esterase/Feruloyl esterase [Xylariomycetidae sp. FL2044]|nr:putative ferulic acid Esterase/Feruloyl esterase [Xylariomycetidae sp. FL2044]